MAPAYDYLRDPGEIYRRSFATARAECDLNGVSPDLTPLVLRLVHACGMPDIVADLRLTDDLMAAGQGALKAGAPIIADCRMVAEGIIRDRLPAGNAVLCPLAEDPAVPALALEQGTTRSAAAVECWRDRLDGAVVAIGNAPTALFRLLEILRDGAPAPAAILGFPVGFIGAAESKAALVEADLVKAGRPIPYGTLLGRRGGSALAAAAVNALAGGLS